MSQQLELLTENTSQWTTVSFVTPEIQKKEIKPFVIRKYSTPIFATQKLRKKFLLHDKSLSPVALKELEGNPDSRTSSLVNADKFSAVRSVVRHVARLRSATKEPWNLEDVTTFLEGLR